MVERFCEHPAEASGVTWLPLYHDLGLIGGVLQPLYAGYHSAIMAPATFLQRPYRWLQAISKWRATISGAPNFAYDLCVVRLRLNRKRHLTSAVGRLSPMAQSLYAWKRSNSSPGICNLWFTPILFLSLLWTGRSNLGRPAGKKGIFPTYATFQARCA